MDMKMKFQKSLPPLVEGKIHGYLKLVVDEVIWSKRNFGEIRVFVSWWGETEKTEFRPADITKDVIRSEQKTTEIYAIRTNINLFEQYIKNCESVELSVVSKQTNVIIGTSQITDLLEIFKYKSYFRYVPIITNYGNKIGEIHVSLKLEHMTTFFNMQLKTHGYDKKQIFDDTLLSTNNNFKNQVNVTSDKCLISRKVKPEENDTYKSILKSRRTEFQEPINKFNTEVADKLVAQIVTRAQRLRGALLKETCDDNGLIFSDNEINNDLKTHIPVEDEVKLHEYFLNEDITSTDECKTICTFRSPSLNASLMDLAFNNSKALRYDNKSITNNISPSKINSLIKDTILKKGLCINSKDNELFDLVTYIKINVISFTLNSAGYRRVKSSSLSHNDNTFSSATYFVQYDMSFDYIREIEKKCARDNKPVRISSKKQTDQVIYFNHSSIYTVSKLKYSTERFIKFKVFVRHFNKKSLIELGYAIMCINDIKNGNCRLAQHLVVANKEIKIGELYVIVELGSDSSHCEGQYVGNIMSTKENIPTLDTQQLLDESRNKRNKSIAESQSRTGNEVSSISNEVVSCLTIDSDLVTTKSISQFATENVDDKKIDTKTYENRIEDKVLLHGLIYILEGQELPELNTYLICRAFWREDKTKSRVCNNTKNPCYQFYQLVPLIYGSDLLERIKDNYIIVEVYSRNNNTDNLLGLTKLSVHPLYVAYRDPRVLPYLLFSKSPVVSVDEWVPIINPVTGRSCGQLLALVALGTAEQIALLKMSKNLENIGTISQTMYLENFSGNTKHSQNMHQLHNTYELQINKEPFSQNNSKIHTTNKVEKELCSSNSRTCECQTDISTVKEFKFNEKSREEASISEHSILHDTVGNFTQVLNVNKINIDQAAQTEISLEEKKQTNLEGQICTNELNCNHSSNDSDNSSVRHHFYLPTETYRSVGVGAEYNEEIIQQPDSDHSNMTCELSTIIHSENETINSSYNQTMFRAIVEIECALHLPKIEKVNKIIDPSTYVSFQANRSDHTKHLNSYMITDVFPHNCNPKWNWKCDTELPTELLLHNEKRLILKIWRILDADTSMEINLERDVVIGFSAIDLSILISGFPTVSGWFHIMDFTGKCNGQIKVSITPLDNLSLFGKPITSLNTTRLPTCSTTQLNWVPLHIYETHSRDTDQNNINYTLATVVQEEEKSVHSENQINDSVTHIGFEDVSMSFLSLSLKQKLTELDEITKRLESRLRDVTNAAFEDDLENEFDLSEPNSNNENNDYKIATPVVSITTTDNNNKICYNTDSKKNENQNLLNQTNIQKYIPQPCISYNKAVICEKMKPNSSKIFNSYTKRNLSNDNSDIQQDEYLMQNIKTLDNTLTDYPEQGTTAHINYLLDKLSLQFPVQSHLTKAVPMKKNITTLLTNLHSSSNNLQDNNKCNQELKISSVHSQTDSIHEQTTQNLENATINCMTNQEVDTYDKNSSANKMSSVIREELIAEENSATSKCDELTTYLVTSNIRHMDLNNIFNPLLYQHLVPDLHYSNTLPEDETIKQLDNRYSKVFSTSISNRLNKIHSLVEANMSLENVDSIDDSIDVTVYHNAKYNDLLASNSTDSTTTISVEKSLVKSVDSEVVETSGDPTFSETSILVLSRQAPDGGNPVEDNKKPLVIPQEDDTLHSLSGTCD